MWRWNQLSSQRSLGSQRVKALAVASKPGEPAAAAHEPYARSAKYFSSDPKHLRHKQIVIRRGSAYPRRIGKDSLANSRLARRRRLICVFIFGFEHMEARTQDRLLLSSICRRSRARSRGCFGDENIGHCRALAAAPPSEKPRRLRCLTIRRSSLAPVTLPCQSPETSGDSVNRRIVDRARQRARPHAACKEISCARLDQRIPL